MEKEILNQLETELAHAGEETSLSPRMLTLEGLRITPEKKLLPMDFLFRLFNKPCFPRGELVAITGKAKSGKTFVTSMLMARSLTPSPSPTGEGSSHLQGERLSCLQRLGDETLKVLWYDTEQSDESTQDILKNRVLRMIDHSNTNDTNLTKGKDSPDLFDTGSTEESVPSVKSVVENKIDVFNVRVVEWKERRALLEEAIMRCKPDLVIVDGIRDLVNDINDGVLAQEVMEELMHLATAGKCCIVCVLHQNKSGEDRNLRGWIGTELMNKAFEVYACEKLMPQRIFKLEQTLTRKYDIEQTMYFEVGEDGLPGECAVPVEDASQEGGRPHAERLPQLNAEYIVHDDSVEGGWQIDVMRLFLDAMRDKREIGGAELRSEVCRLANIAQYKFYNKLLQRAQDEKVIVKVERDKHTFYQPAPF